MKKILFATTALVATAGVAAADVTTTGFAEMGLMGGDGVDTQFFTDIDVTFKMSLETDNGLTFSAAVDLDESTGAAPAVNDNADDGGISITMSGGFGNLTMGDTDGAFDWALKEVALVGGSIADNETAHSGYNGNSLGDGSNGGDGQILRYDYSFDAFSVGVSVEQQGNGAGDTTFGLGAKFSTDLGGTSVGVGIGYQDNSVNSETGISLDASFGGGFSAAINYSDLDGLTKTVDGVATAMDTHMGIGIGYSSGAVGVGLNYGSYSPSAAGADDVTGFGLAATYDLGGGAVIQFGYGSSDTPAGSSNDYSLGFALSF